MKKTIKTGPVILAAAFMLLNLAGQAGAFCVHNRSSAVMHVRQTSNGSLWKPFVVTLNPGEQACCSWETKDCNKSGGRKDYVGFEVVTKSCDGNEIEVSACIGYKIPADANLYIRDEAHCVTFSCHEEP